MVVRRNISPKKTSAVKFVDQDETNPTVIAICSTENSYRLSWLIDNAMSLNMALYSNSNLPDTYSDVCVYTAPDGELPMLISNRISEAAYFLPKLKKFDYLLILSGISGDDIGGVEMQLRKINGIIATFVPAVVDKKINDFVKLF